MVIVTVYVWLIRNGILWAFRTVRNQRFSITAKINRKAFCQILSVVTIYSQNFWLSMFHRSRELLFGTISSSSTTHCAKPTSSFFQTPRIPEVRNAVENKSFKFQMQFETLPVYVLQSVKVFVGKHRSLILKKKKKKLCRVQRGLRTDFVIWHSLFKNVMSNFWNYNFDTSVINSSFEWYDDCWQSNEALNPGDFFYREIKRWYVQCVAGIFNKLTNPDPILRIPNFFWSLIIKLLW